MQLFGSVTLLVVMWELFFTANIRNPNTRRAYYKASARFSEWWEGRGLSGLTDVKPLHVAAYIEWQGITGTKGGGAVQTHGETTSGSAADAV